MRFLILISFVGLLFGSLVSANAQDKYIKIAKVELDGQEIEVNELIVFLFADRKARGIRARVDGLGFFVPAELAEKDIGITLLLKPQLYRLTFGQVSARYLDSPWTIGIDTEPFDCKNLFDRDPSKIELIYYLLPVGYPGDRIVKTEGKPGVTF